VAKGWGPGTRERQHASRDTIPERWGERTHPRTQAQLSLNRSALAATRLQLLTLASGVGKTNFTLDISAAATSLEATSCVCRAGAGRGCRGGRTEAGPDKLRPLPRLPQGMALWRRSEFLGELPTRAPDPPTLFSLFPSGVDSRPEKSKNRLGTRPSGLGSGGETRWHGLPMHARNCKAVPLSFFRGIVDRRWHEQTSSAARGAETGCAPGKFKNNTTSWATSLDLMPTLRSFGPSSTILVGRISPGPGAPTARPSCCAYSAPACALLAFVCVFTSLLVLADTACLQERVVLARAPRTRMSCTCLRVLPLCLRVCFVLHLFDILNCGEFSNPIDRCSSSG